MTRQRQAVGNALKDAGRTHPTAEAVFLLARNHLPGIALGTVYRNLSQMCDEGEVLRITVPGGADRYDADTSRHDHLICEGCGRVYDIPHGAVYIPDSHMPPGIKLIDSELLLKCICADCRNADGSNKTTKNTEE